MSTIHTIEYLHDMQYASFHFHIVFHCLLIVGFDKLLPLYIFATVAFKYYNHSWSTHTPCYKPRFTYLLFLNSFCRDGKLSSHHISPILTVYFLSSKNIDTFHCTENQVSNHKTKQTNTKVVTTIATNK